MKFKLSLTVLIILSTLLSNAQDVENYQVFKVTDIEYMLQEDTSYSEFFSWDESVSPASDIYEMLHYPDRNLWEFVYKDHEDGPTKKLSYVYFNGGEPGNTYTVLGDVFCNIPVIKYQFSMQDWLKVELSRNNCWFYLESDVGPVLVRLGLKQTYGKRIFPPGQD